MSRKRIWFQGAGASIFVILLLFGWITLNSGEQSAPMLVKADKAPVKAPVEMVPRERIMEERGEPAEPEERMDRAEAIRRAEELSGIAHDPNVSPEVRERAQEELDRFLAENFPTAAAEPKNGDHDAPSWGAILRNAINEGIPYFFMLVQLAIGEVTRRRLKRAKEAA